MSGAGAPPPERTNARAEVASAARFGLVGLAATGLHLGVAHIALSAIGVAPWLANVFGFLSAFVFAALGHHHFSFAARTPIRRSFARYGAVALCGFAVNAILLETLLSLDLVAAPVALTISILIVPLGTWAASRFWAFAKH